MRFVEGAKQVAHGLGKILIPPKKTVEIKELPKDFLHESTEDYAEQLKKRRSRGY